MSRSASLAAVLAVAALSSTAAIPASDDLRCGERALIVSKLGQIYREIPAAVGVVNKDAVIEVFVSNNGTWTILATSAKGESCVLSSGEAWESTTFVKGEDA